MEQEKTISNRVNEIILNTDIEDFNKLTVNWISKKMGVTANYLSRKYKVETSKNLTNFLQLQKLSISLAFLFKFPQLRVKEVAEIFGFNSYDYYIKLFKRLYGTSPDRYRKFLLKLAPKL